MPTTDAREMEAFVNERLAQLRSDYDGEVTDICCALRNTNTLLEMSYSFTLIRDQVAREHVVKMGSVVSTNQIVRLRYIDSAFRFIRGMIDDAIAGADHLSR